MIANCDRFSHEIITIIIITNIKCVLSAKCAEWLMSSQPPSSLRGSAVLSPLHGGEFRCPLEISWGGESEWEVPHPALPTVGLLPSANYAKSTPVFFVRRGNEEGWEPQNPQNNKRISKWKLETIHFFNKMGSYSNCFAPTVQFLFMSWFIKLCAHTGLLFTDVCTFNWLIWNRCFPKGSREQVI